MRCAARVVLRCALHMRHGTYYCCCFVVADADAATPLFSASYATPCFSCHADMLPPMMPRDIDIYASMPAAMPRFAAITLV